MSAPGPPDETRLREEVRREVVAALSGSPGSAGRGRELVAEKDVLQARHGSRVIRVSAGAIITPSARDAAERHGVRIEVGGPSLAPPASPPPGRSPGDPPAPASAPPAPPQATGAPLPRRVGVASDHAGFRLKTAVAAHLERMGVQVRDFGTRSEESCDYPDFVLPAAAAVATGEVDRAVVVDCHGNASALAANKVPGVRAAACATAEQVTSARGHNDINVLALGQTLLTAEGVSPLLEAFLATSFQGDRHARRMGKIAALERQLHAAARRTP